MPGAAYRQPDIACDVRDQAAGFKDWPHTPLDQRVWFVQ
jgi:hypothetical protein